LLTVLMSFKLHRPQGIHLNWTLEYNNKHLFSSKNQHLLGLWKTSG
jgi:hypothetical protein